MRKNKNKSTKKSLINSIKDELQPGKFDPNGSYTGLTENGELPVQDQDDL